MGIQIKRIQPTDAPLWDTYVHSHPHSTLYHLSGWKNVIEKTYAHKTYYLMAVNSSKLKAQSSQQAAGLIDAQSTNYDLSAISYQLSASQIVGILPLVHLKHLFFGNSLISIPFFDLGGILADDKETEKVLLSEAIKLGEDLEVNHIELRHIEPLPWLVDSSQHRGDSAKPSPITSPFRRRRIELSQFHPRLPLRGTSGQEETEKTKISSKSCLPRRWEPSYWGKSCLKKNKESIIYATKSHKVRMLLQLPDSSKILMKSLKAKLRSQIKKPMKEGLRPKVGSLELLDDFYKVFSINMRDLGSPVHSKKLIQNVLEEFPEKSKIVMVYKDGQPTACSLVVGFKGTLENPWASALREYSRLSPNMLLYWSMLEYACNHGFDYFDFGRSSPDEGTYKFKEQWGAKPTPLHWHYVSLNGQPFDEETPEKSKFEKAVHYWQRLPVPITKILGPMIRRHIGL